jgi:hypothetical protein
MARDYPNTFLAGRVLSTEPLVTFSSTNRDAPLGIASVAGDLFAARPALHLLHHTWTLEQGDASWIAAAVRRARTTMPRASFVMLASNETEAQLYTDQGETAIVASALLFTDERIWRPMPPAPGPQYDAIYVGRLERMKRHELATAIPSLQLVYARPPNNEQEGDGLARVRGLLPNARFANHVLGDQYSRFSHEQVAALMAQSSVGLCLSAVEGCMRTSMEYMFSGLPVVSTRSIGGRDRYFVGAYTRIVDDDPEAVAAAVADLKQQRFDRNRIREHIGQIVAFERHNFLVALDKMIERKFRQSGVFKSTGAFAGATEFARSDAIRERAAEAVAKLPAPKFHRGAAGAQGAAKAGQASHAVIVAKARTGTNFLRSILGVEPWITNVGEIFNPAMVKTLPNQFVHFVRERFRTDEQLDLSADTAEGLLTAYFEAIGEGPGAGKTVVLDIKEDSLRSLDWTQTAPNRRPRLAERLVEMGKPILRLTRRNLLAQHVSNEYARARNVWVQFKGREAPWEGSPVRLNPKSLPDRLRQQQEDVRRVDQWLGDGPNIHRIVYEDMVGEDDALTDGAREIISRALGRELNPAVTAKTERTTPALRDAIANYDEVAEVLRGTDFEGFLSADPAVSP